MPYLTIGKENSNDIEIYYKDRGSGQPMVFSHGRPSSVNIWERAEGVSGPLQKTQDTLNANIIRDCGDRS